MTRGEFIKICSILGIGLPIQATFGSCINDDSISNLPNKVIIIGAGAAGLSAAYLLNQRGIDVQILEASSRYGGRMKRTLDFADFPIPLGAEWLHVEKDILDEIVNGSSVQAEVNTTPYDLDEDYGLFEGQQISVEDVGFTIDQKFINSSWLDFYEQYVLPSVENRILFNK